MTTSELLEEIVEAPETAPPTAPRRVLETIRTLHESAGRLSRVHHTHPALYAQARRVFGTWRAAVAAAGLDYAHERSESLKRGLTMRDQRRAVWHALARFLVDHPAADDLLLDSERPELAGRVRRCWGSLGAARAWSQQRGSRGSA